jgi:hypothetical protein
MAGMELPRRKHSVVGMELPRRKHSTGMELTGWMRAMTDYGQYETCLKFWNFYISQQRYLHYF